MRRARARRFPLKIGGSLDPESPSITVEAKVLKLDDPCASDQRQAVVVIDGITVILAARRRPYHMIADFTRLGFDPKAVRLLVVKSGYLSPELAPIANPNLMALTEGYQSGYRKPPQSPPGWRFYPWKPHFNYIPKPILSARW